MIIRILTILNIIASSLIFSILIGLIDDQKIYGYIISRASIISIGFATLYFTMIILIIINETKEYKNRRRRIK